MIDKISYELVKYLSEKVDFVDTWAGLVKPMRKKVQTTDKVFPVAINTPSTCNQSDYMALVPDSGKKSVVYVEKMSDPIIEMPNKRYKHVSATIRLVVWYNLDKLTAGDYISADVLTDEMLGAIPRRLDDSLFIGAKQVHFAPTGIIYGTDIVNQYTYKEIKTQFNTHPYGLFAIDMDVWYISTHCQPTLTPESGCVTGKGNHETKIIWDYEGVMTIGNLGINYGYTTDNVGSVSPELGLIRGFDEITYTIFYISSVFKKLSVSNGLNAPNRRGTAKFIEIDGVEYELDALGECNSDVNPFSDVGSTVSIKLR